MGRGHPQGYPLLCIPGRLGDSLSVLLQTSLAPSTRAHYESAWRKVILFYRDLAQFLDIDESTIFRNCVCVWGGGGGGGQEEGEGEGEGEVKATETYSYLTYIYIYI